MTLKDYLKQKPTDEFFDLIPAVYKGRSLYTYEDKKIKLIETDPRNTNRKIIYLEEQ